MSEILLYYRRPDPTTWVYLSSFLTIGLFFVFHRFWSIRNLDIVLLILLAPGLLMVYEGRRRQLVESEMIQTEMSMSDDTGDQSEVDGEPLGGIGPLIRSSGSTPADQLTGAELDASENTDKTQSGNPADTPIDSSTQPTNSDGVSQTSFIEMTKAVSGSLVGFVSQAIDGQRSGEASSVVSVGVETQSGIVDENESSVETQSRRSSDLGEVASTDLAVLEAVAGQPDEVLSETTEAIDLSQVGSINNESFIARLLRGPEDPRELQKWGFVYLFVIEALLLLRLMLDPLMVRRPLLDPNLTTGGLYFIGISLFVFMMANVVTSSPRVQVQQGPELGPGYAMMNLLPAIPTRPVSDQPGGVIPPRVSELTPKQLQLAKVAKTLAIIAQFSIVVGIVLIGSRHFANVRAGVGCSLLYLLLPYTAQMTGRVDHVLPAALLLWAVLCYRRPVVSGIFLGLAGGLVYYPLFLLPLWGSFYWRRGARKFAAGVASMLILLMVALSFDSSASLSDHLYRMFGLLKPIRDPGEFRGLWALGWNPIWRLPVIVGFAILAVFFSIWPARKNLGTLMSSSAALMVAAQFWHGYGGGLYIAWFIPLLLLVIFRPNLQDRIAAKVVMGKQPMPLFGDTETEPA